MNQRVIADNATGKGSGIARGAARRGALIVAGLLRCGHCGRKLYVGYGGKSGRYYCQGAVVNHGTERCISFGGLTADQAVATELLHVLRPLGMDAAVRAFEAQTTEMSAARRQLELALAQARYETAHERRQYDSVDPANRLVAGELERRWNEALQAVHRIESEIGSTGREKAAAVKREGARAPDAARCRPGARLVASGRECCDSQADPTRGTA
ncbi:zinc ribbon domain-containing protein [Bradyrhizobium sp. 76]|nr:zinc ribbon domain-containing protein [Bradyrhizobium sp. 76]MCK1409953.1 zinc ribbon domain-containing protein [Bradyrhizobium sp. 76]